MKTSIQPEQSEIFYDFNFDSDKKTQALPCCQENLEEIKYINQ